VFRFGAKFINPGFEEHKPGKTFFRVLKIRQYLLITLQFYMSKLKFGKLRVETLFKSEGTRVKPILSWLA